ncbi:MAG: hypothetical protein HYX90_05015 [Chloroflexi bacterium]|nr:hypothetical protein [Chloroflexota bacterium]
MMLTRLSASATILAALLLLLACAQSTPSPKETAKATSLPSPDHHLCAHG